MIADKPALTRQRPADWLPRAILSGFIATVAMSILFFVAFGLARAASNIELAPRRGGPTFGSWLDALTSNQVLDLAAGSLYAAGAVHLMVGVLWAVAYAYYFEPRLPGPPWVRGVTFSLIPGVMSVIVFLPLVGGGLFGAAIGAGPLPTIGNIMLHLGYGAALGAIYGPLGDIAADEFPHRGVADAPQVVAGYESAAARGILFGAIIGAAIGLLGAATISLRPDAAVLGMPPLAVLPITIVLGATFGGVLNSIAGLSSTQPR